MRDDLKAYVDGALPPQRAEEIRKAAEADPKLAEEIRQIEMLSSILSEETAGVPVRGKEETLSILNRPSPRRETWLGPLLWAGGLAAAFAIGVIGSKYLNPGRVQPGSVAVVDRTVNPGIDLAPFAKAGSTATAQSNKSTKQMKTPPAAPAQNGPTGQFKKLPIRHPAVFGIQKDVRRAPSPSAGPPVQAAKPDELPAKLSLALKPTGARVVIEEPRPSKGERVFLVSASPGRQQDIAKLGVIRAANENWKIDSADDATKKAQPSAAGGPEGYATKRDFAGKIASGGVAGAAREKSTTNAQNVEPQEPMLIRVVLVRLPPGKGSGQR